MNSSGTGTVTKTPRFQVDDNGRLINTKGRHPLPHFPPATLNLQRRHIIAMASQQPDSDRGDDRIVLSSLSTNDLRPEAVASPLTAGSGEKRAVAAASDDNSDAEPPTKRSRTKKRDENDPHLKHMAPENVSAAKEAPHWPHLNDDGEVVNFSWTKNSHISREPAKINVKDATKTFFKLTDDQDFEYETVTWLHAATMDWSCVECLKALNRWRHQIIYRRLDKNDPTIQKAQRPTWTWIEMMWVIESARDIISEKDPAMFAKHPSMPLLDDADWVVIKDQLNERFKDSVARIGERTAEATKNPVLKKSHKILSNRNTKAIRSQTAKWPSFKAMEDEEREKLIARGRAEAKE